MFIRMGRFLRLNALFTSLVVVLLLQLSPNLLAQVFIPFGFWSSQSGLSVTPATSPLYMQTGDLQSFTITGATGVHTVAITGAAIADGALLNGASSSPIVDSTPDYNSRLTAGTADTITITSGSYTTTISVYAYDPITVAPSSLTIAINGTQNFTTTAGCLNATCSGGSPTWSIVSGGGSITSGGVFTAPGTAGSTVVQVADYLGNVAQATVTIVSSLTISPLGWSTQNIKLPIYSTETYSATLGTTPYTYSIFAGSGTNGCQSTLNGAITNVSTTVTVVNTTGCPGKGAIYVDSETICYNTTTATTFTGLTRGCNGTTAAAHLIGVTYNLNKTIHTAPSATGSGTVRVTDTAPATSDSVVTYIQPTGIAMGYAFVCAMYSDGSVKCWGENNGGQLGIGSTSSIGTVGTQLGGGIAFVNLGAGRTATQIAAGWYHVCALLDDSTVKCWGQNAYGQLGDGTTTNRGTTTSSDVANLAAIDFKGKTPTQIYAFGYTSCALFSDNTSVCWGLNSFGQLGQNNRNNYSQPPYSGGSLTPIDYGSPRYATKLAGGPDFTCAILDDASVKCWGSNGKGQLGDNTAGCQSTLSAALTNVAVTATVTNTTGCPTSGAVYIDSEVISYTGTTGTTFTGLTRGVSGTTAAAHTSGTTYYRAALPSFTAAINLGGGRTATDISAGADAASTPFNGHACAVLDNGTLACWGRGSNGQIGDNASTNRSVPTQTTALGFTASKIWSARRWNCVMSTANAVKCWGQNSRGQLLRGNTTTQASAGAATAVNWGTNVGFSTMASAGRTGCMITGGGTANNGRIKCWGTGANSGGTAVGVLLYPGLGATSYLGDAAGELGDGLPFMNH